MKNKKTHSADRRISQKKRTDYIGKRNNYTEGVANGEEAKTQVYFTPKKKEMVSTQVNVNVTIFNFQRYKLHAMLK